MFEICKSDQLWLLNNPKGDTRSKMTTVQCTRYRGQQGKEKS